MFIRFFLKVSIALVFLFFFKTGNSQIDTSTISAVLSRNKEKQAKDAVFILAKEGKVIYKKEMGAMNAKTPIKIGASSQWLTSALVMLFVQEGKISLDDKVSTYIPLYTKHFKSFITIRQCLTNYTGIQFEQGVAKLLQKNKFNTLEEEVNSYASKREIETNPGTEFKYSNLGFNIAGRVLEVVSKKSFDRLMNDRILRPLGMKGSTFTNENYNDAINPSTGATSTAADFTNFLTMLLNKGTFNNKQILTPASVETLLTLQVEAGNVKYAPKTNEGLNYALGIWILENDAKNKPTSFTVPSLHGFVPVIDVCRGYAMVYYTRASSDEQKRDAFMNIKATVDEEIKGNCQ